MLWRCSGCNDTFMLENHYVQHLRTGRRPECALAREEYRGHVQRPFRHDPPTRRPRHHPQNEQACSRAPLQTSTLNDSRRSHEIQQHTSSDDDGMDVDPEPSPVPFEGDMFGSHDEYREEEFPFGGEDMTEPRIPEATVRSAPIVQETSDDEDDDLEEAVGCDILEPPTHPQEHLQDECDYNTPPRSPLPVDLHLEADKLGVRLAEHIDEHMAEHRGDEQLQPERKVRGPYGGGRGAGDVDLGEDEHGTEPGGVGHGCEVGINFCVQLQPALTTESISV
ncbi:hypothetical protein BD413DRAFT_158732 [Trametes elegans]|nr:hypothetical protein BD413DRAFT_158732 [Trametes elegans]